MELDKMFWLLKEKKAKLGFGQLMALRKGELAGLLWTEIVAPAVEEGKEEKLLFSDHKGYGMDVEGMEEFSSANDESRFGRWLVTLGP